MEIAEYLRRDHGISLSLQQREAVEETHGHILLLAVPGAGKTTVLTARLANLIVNQGADPTRIAALTFNRESARDKMCIRDRLGPVRRRWRKNADGASAGAHGPGGSRQRSRSPSSAPQEERRAPRERFLRNKPPSLADPSKKSRHSWF